VSILEDEAQIKAFAEKTRVLHNVPVVENNEPVQETTPAVSDITNTPFIIYFSGLDNDATELSISRSDVNILMVVNPETKQILMVNTPRDYYVVHPYGNGGRDKLTHCGIYGIDCSIQALEKLYGVDVAGYAQINFTGFETLIDAIGGITVYFDTAFTACGETYISVGENYLNGHDALNAARERYTLAGGDNARGQNQMKIIKAVIQKLASGAIISNYADIMDSVEGMFTMNIPAEMISELMKMQLSDMARWNIVSYSAKGGGFKAETYSMPGMELWVTEPNKYSVQKAIRLIDMVFAGERLTEEVINSIN
jgi:LCP family protein required for cell wall assembly